jgi:flagellar basal-body rod modification protein FlgD
MAVDYNTIQSLGLAAPAAQVQKKNQLQQDDFMKLLTTQLTHQDPLKPQESAEFLTQLAQFGTVNGIQELQKSFADFTASSNQEQALLAGNLIGRSALIPSDKAVLAANGTVQGELNLPADASALALQVFNANGQLMRTMDLGPQSTGSLPFQWDGKLDDGVSSADPGLYKIKANAVIDGKTIALETQIAAPVESVTVGGAQGPQVQFKDLGTYALKDIAAIL